MGEEQINVIVGASLTGAKAAEAMLEAGFEGKILLLGSEAERPYERPPLSKEYLRGEADPPWVHDEGFYDDERIELRTGVTVDSIDPTASTLTTDRGEILAWDRLLLATGAEPRRLELPGSDLVGVAGLRTLADSAALGQHIEQGVRVAVIGAGWIGAEVATSARQKGCEVTMIAPEKVPLERVLGEELGAFYGGVHEAEGVRFLGETGITGFTGTDRVEAVTTDSGLEIAADLVVVGVGVTPRTGLAEAAGIATDDGILVDASLQTDHPGIYAAGDVANAWNPFYEQRIRVEHWANAKRQGAAAGRSMAGEPVEFDEIPYFFSDQYDVGMEYVGYATDWDQIVYRGSVEKREFIAFWLKGGRLVAGMNVNVWEVSDQIRDLIRAKAEPDREALADPNRKLDSL